MGNKKIDLTMLERKDLIQYCRDNNIDVRTKDDTKTILKKALKAIESLSNTKVPDAKPKAAVAPKEAPKAASKKEVKKEPVKPTKGKTVVVKKEKSFVPVTFKSVGQNVIVIVDGTQYSKKEESKANRDAIKGLVEEINNSQDNSRKNALVDIFKEKASRFEKRAENSFEGLSVEDLLSKITDPELKGALAEKLKVEAKKKVEEAPKTQAVPSQRTGEKPYK